MKDEAKDEAYWAERAARLQAQEEAAIRESQERELEQQQATDRKRGTKIAAGQLLPGRIVALVVLCVITVLMVGVALVNFASIQTVQGICVSTKGPCSTIRAYAFVDLLLAACAAFGAIIVYWSRPRG
jgi:hypothetical protein